MSVRDVLSLAGRVVVVLAVGAGTVVGLYWNRMLSAGLFGGFADGSSLLDTDLRVLATLPLATVAIPTRGKATVALPWVAAGWFGVAALLVHRSASATGLPWWTYAIEIVLVAGYVALVAIALGLIVAGRRRLGGVMGAMLAAVGLAVALLPGGPAFAIAIWVADLVLAVVTAMIPPRNAP